MNRKPDGRFVISERWDGIVDSLSIFGLVFFLGWMVGIIQASSWTR